jgi:hypothetical protein
VDEEGNFSAALTITQFGMKMGAPGATVTFDSDHAEDAPEEFRPLTAMLNVEIPCRISPVGELLETDLEPLRLAVRRAGAAALAEEMEKTTDKMFEGAFVQFAKDPIEAGETYEAGTIVEEAMKVHMSYRLAAVSGDRKQAILEPVAKMEIQPEAFPGVEVKIHDTRMNGWILHDVERGFARDSELRLYMGMEITAEGETAPAVVKMAMRMKTTLSE